MTLSLIPGTNYKYLKQTGIKTNGIVYKQKTNLGYSALISLMKTRAIVRFKTQNLAWIDAEVDQNIPAFLNDNLKVGRKIELYYDEKDPRKIFLDNAKSEAQGRILFFIIGFLMTVGSIYFISGY
jgi:hypothetical protein